MKKLFDFLKDKANLLVSLVTLIAAIICTIINIWSPNDKLSGTMVITVLTLIAIDLFGLLVGRIDSIHNALKDIKSNSYKGAQLREWDASLTGTIINGAQEELFFCGCFLSKLLPHHEEILVASNRVKRIRLLVMDSDNEEAYKKYIAIYGRSPILKSLDHLKGFASNQNIEIRIIEHPITLFVSAKDMQTTTGRMRVGFLGFKKSGHTSPFVDLTPVDEKWYDYYKEQIEMLWDQGTPWHP